MFTGFASENTPAIQVWDFSKTIFGTNRICLADDCAPIQIFKTGNTTTPIQVHLPTAPIEGKQIKIINAAYGSAQHPLDIWGADSGGSGAGSSIIRIGSSQVLDLCYSKDSISNSPGVGDRQTGWFFLNQGAISSFAFNSVNLGGNNSSVVASRAVAIGGSSHLVSGSNAAIIAGGSGAASGSNSVIVGGQSNTASGSESGVFGGSSNTANASQAVVVGGVSNVADAANNAVVGGNSGTTRGIIGNFVTPASSVPIINSIGKQQLATLLLGRETTNATPTVLASNVSTASTTNQVILPNNSAYTFQGTCIANVTGGGNTSSWKFEGAIKRGANAASTALVAAVTPTVIAQNAGASTWVLAITADTTNGGIAVTVTGQAATTIRWVCKIETTEVTF